jgi:hypothetical protein
MTGRLRAGFASVAQQCSLGLIGLPDALRNTAIASMDRRIGDPDFPISTLFFTTLSLLHVSSGSTWEEIHQQRQPIDAALSQTVFSSMPKKVPLARAETVQTLLFFGSNIDTPEVKSKMAALLPAHQLTREALLSSSSINAFAQPVTAGPRRIARELLRLNGWGRRFPQPIKR